MTPEQLIQENKTLQQRLSVAEKWMQREIQSSLSSIQKSRLKDTTRSHFANIFEIEGMALVNQKVRNIYTNILKNAPKYTLERLIDAEIYWQTLQKYPTLDALPIIILYQKIFDSWIEEYIIAPWRNHQKFSIYPNFSDQKIPSSLEQDLHNIITKGYTLSIGRLYALILLTRQKSNTGLASMWLGFLGKNQPKLLKTLLSDVFLKELSILIDREVFSTKRHSKKVSFRDAKEVMKICHSIFSKFSDI